MLLRMAATQLQRHDARTIVEWVLGVTGRPATRPDGHHFDLWEKGELVGGLLVVSAGAVPTFPDGDRAGGGADRGTSELAPHRTRPRASASLCPPVVVSATSGAERAGSAAAVNEVIEDEAWRKENLDRLGGVGGGQRHLFVWLGEEHGDAFSAMDRDVPPEPPLQPLGITTLWSARRPAARAGWLADRVWQSNPRGEWEALEAVPRSCDHAAARRASVALQRR